MRKAISCLLLLALTTMNLSAQLLPTFGNSRTGASGMQFLKIGPDARSASLSGAVVGITNDVSSLYWNPSGMTSSDTGNLNLMFSNTRYVGTIKQNFAGAVFKTGKLSYVGVQIISMDYGRVEETTEFQPYGTGRQVVLNNTLVGLSFAKILTDNFSFGLSGKWAHESLGDVRINNYLFDLGLTYNIGLNYGRFGVAFSNFGLNVAPTGEVSFLNLSGTQTQNKFADVSAPGMFRVGGAFDPIHNGMHILTLAGQLNHPTDNNETFAFGAEYSYKRILYGRTGWEFGSDEASRFPSIGFGLRLPRKFQNFRMDYGLISKERLGNMHRITLSLNIRK